MTILAVGPESHGFIPMPLAHYLSGRVMGIHGTGSADLRRTRGGVSVRVSTQACALLAKAKHTWARLQPSQRLAAGQCLRLTDNLVAGPARKPGEPVALRARLR